MTTVGTVCYEVSEGVAIVTIDNPPKRNAISTAMWRQLATVAATLAEPGSRARVVVLRGAGEAAFSAGADLDEMPTTEVGRSESTEIRDAITAAEDAWERCPVPTIAMIHGACIGGGLLLSLACDVRVAAESATFRIPVVQLGLPLRRSAGRRLVGLIGSSHARYILYSGRTFHAREALAHGLVSDVLSDDELTAHVIELAGAVARSPQHALGETRSATAGGMK